MEKLLRRAAHSEPGKFNDLSGSVAKLSRSAFLKYSFFLCFCAGSVTWHAFLSFPACSIFTRLHTGESLYSSEQYLWCLDVWNLFFSFFE